MIEQIDTSLIDWSRAQFALTAMYHWLFVPLTLGLGIIMSIMETIYVKTGDPFWKRTALFWIKLFGINFAIGIATGIILEFEFGTNWSNYSWFVGDIFGAPLAIEGMFAFFMEATFVAVLFFGWDKVSKRMHLAANWLTSIGAILSAIWILVANAWMQYPVGMAFNPDTVRNEMIDFWAIVLSPVAINKILHTVLSSWILGAVFVIGISSWFLLKKREIPFALASIKIAAWVGLVSSTLTVWTGDGSAYQVAQKQPMKLAAIEALYEGGTHVDLIAIGMLNPEKKSYLDNKDPYLWAVRVPSFLSILAQRSADGYVPGINNIIEGGYQTKDGIALSAEEKITRGKKAITALANYRLAKANKHEEEAKIQKSILETNFPYFGYGYIKIPTELVPNIHLIFYSFRIMVILGFYFIALFIFALWMGKKELLSKKRWIQHLFLWSIPLAYFASQAGWVVAEVGRQPWSIQDILPTSAGVSRLDTSSVQITFFLFLSLFAILLIAEISIMVKEIKKGPSESNHLPH